MNEGATEMRRFDELSSATGIVVSPHHFEYLIESVGLTELKYCTLNGKQINT